MSKNDRIGAITRVAVGIKHEYQGVALDVLNRLNSVDAAAWKDVYASAHQRGAPRPATELLRLISDKPILIPSTDGARTIISSTDVFGWIDPHFVNYGCNAAANATDITPTKVYEMTKPFTFATLFEQSFQYQLDDLCFTQDQIVSFVVEHPEYWRTDSYATFFLFEVNGAYFVASVDLDSNVGWYVYVYRFSNDHVWDAVGHRRVVVPSLGTSAV